MYLFDVEFGKKQNNKIARYFYDGNFVCHREIIYFQYPSQPVRVKNIKLS